MDTEAEEAGGHEDSNKHNNQLNIKEKDKDERMDECISPEE